MSINEETLYTTMLNALISKFGLMLTSKQCAEALAISTRTLEERRKASEDCPSYVKSAGGRTIYFPAQNIVQYQLEKAKQSIKIA
jgi:hypothetical protein